MKSRFRDVAVPLLPTSGNGQRRRSIPLTDAVIGVDIGTTFIKAVVYDSQLRPRGDGTVRTPWSPTETGAEIHPVRLAEAAISAIEMALRHAHEVTAAVAIGVTGMGETGVLVDGGGEAVAPAIAWHDQRGRDQAEALERDLPGFALIAGRRANDRPSVVKWRWLADEGVDLRQVRRWMSVAEWVVASLGGTPASELSLASRTGAIDVRRRSVSDEVLDRRSGVLRARCGDRVITTITLNPSFDLTLEVDALVPGGVIRATTERIEAAGKGVNVTRALAINGVPSRAVAALDPATATRYEELLDVADVLDVIPIAGILRTNVALVSPGGVVTKINGPGPTHTSTTVDAIRAAIRARVAESSWIVLSGSLPPGCPDDLYAQVIREAFGDCSVALDAEADALRLGVAAGPTVVKPNLAELSDLAGSPLRTLGEVHDAARQLRELGAQTVLCSLGVDGALLVTDEGALHAKGPPHTRGSDVGAGDALLAGFLSEEGDNGARLHRAVAWGGAACRLPGSQMPGHGDIALNEVVVTDAPDWKRVLQPVTGQDAAEAA